MSLEESAVPASPRPDSATETTVERLKAVRLSLRPCRPPLWALAGHQQTILAHLLPSPPLAEKGEDLAVTLESEAERIATTYLAGTSNTVVYLFHGLGGTSEATYMQRTAAQARALGHHVFLNNHRGCGAGSGLAVEPYHSGRAEDLSAVIAFGRKKLPGHRHVAIGFSLSANALLLLAAGRRADVLPDAAIAVNGPIVLDNASKKLCEGLNLIYNFNFLIELKRSIRERAPRLDRAYPTGKVWTIREFDEVYTAPAGGFANRDEYYSTCSAQRYLSEIAIPTVLLTAADDPFVDVRDYLDADLSKTTVLHVEKHGGHMGYLDRSETNSSLGYRRWLDYALKEYLIALA